MQVSKGKHMLPGPALDSQKPGQALNFGVGQWGGSRSPLPGPQSVLQRIVSDSCGIWGCEGCSSSKLINLWLETAARSGSSSGAGCYSAREILDGFHSL